MTDCLVVFQRLLSLYDLGLSRVSFYREKVVVNLTKLETNDYR